MVFRLMVALKSFAPDSADTIVNHVNENEYAHILTIEDPVEYAVHGVGQTQVNTKVGMTFAAGLRANNLTGYLRSYRIFAFSDDTLAPKAGGIRCPALIITGEFDHGSTVAMAHALGARIAGSKVVILQGLRHLVTTEAPAL